MPSGSYAMQVCKRRSLQKLHQRPQVMVPAPLSLSLLIAVSSRLLMLLASTLGHNAALPLGLERRELPTTEVGCRSFLVLNMLFSAGGCVLPNPLTFY